MCTRFMKNEQCTCCACALRSTEDTCLDNDLRRKNNNNYRVGRYTAAII